MIRRKAQPVAGQSMAACDVVVGRTETFMLAPGLALRAAPCLICRSAVGGAPVCLVAFFTFDHQACSCGVLPQDTHLVHAAHRDLDDMTLFGLAARYQGIHHPEET